MFDRKQRIVITDCDHPTVEIERKVLSEIDPEFILVQCNTEDEENNRKTNSYKKRYSKARLPAYKNIEDFDFSFQPSIDKRTINDGLTCNFITEKRNIVLIGNPGTGKTHLSISIAIKALMKGYKVLFTPVAEMLHNLNAAKADNTYYQKVDYYLKPDLLILDELGFKKLPTRI